MGTKENGAAFIVVEADGKEEGEGLVVGMPMSVSSPVVASDQACFKVLGVDSQILEVTLPPQGHVLCQPGNLVHMDAGFKGTITTGGIGRAFQRSMFAGESFYRVNYHNHATTDGTIGLTPPFPAKVIPVNLDKLNGLTIKNNAFLATLDPKTDISLKIVRNMGTACFGGQGLLLNRLKGEGWVFLNAAGTVLHKQLGPGEKLIVDTNSLVAFENTCQYEIISTGGIGMVCCGGEGIFNTKMTGPGLVIVQSMSLEKMRLAIGSHPHVSSNNNDD